MSPGETKRPASPSIWISLPILAAYNSPVSDHSPLCDVFAAHAAPDTLSTLVRDHSDELEPVLEQLLDTARTAWPRLAVPAPLFIQHLAERASAAGSCEELLQGLRALAAPSLYLTCGCTYGFEEALRSFDSQLMHRVPVFVSHLRLPAAYVEDVQQELRHKLLVSAGAKPPGIAAYGGRGELANFVRAAAVRAAISGRRSKDEQSERDDGSLAERMAGYTADPALESLKQRYLVEFKEAISAAIAQLPTEQRNLLRLFYVDGITTVQLGAMFGVNQSSTSRRLTAARNAILEETKRSLRSRLKLSESSFKELSQLVQSQLDLSLSRLLK